MNLKKIEEIIATVIEESRSFIKEGEVQVATNTGTTDNLTPEQKKRIQDARKVGDAVKIVKKTEPVSEKKKEDKGDKEPMPDTPEEAPEEAPTSIDDLKASLQDVVSKLETMDDFKIGDKEDLKAKKLINKIKIKLDDVTLVMDDLAEIKSGLEERKAVYEEKENDSYLKQVHKLVSKRFRDKKDVEGIMKKYAATAKKHKDKDPNKVAEALFRHMLMESVQYKKRLNELSPELKHAAATKAGQDYSDSLSSNPFQANKRLNQHDKFSSHINPATKKAADNIANKVGDGYKALIKKLPISSSEPGKEYYVVFVLVDETEPTPKTIFDFHIENDKVDIGKNMPPALKFNGFDNVLSKFVELVRKNEFPK